MTPGRSNSPGRYSTKRSGPELLGGKVGLQAAVSDRDERLEQLEEMLSRHEAMLLKLMAATDAIRERLDQQAAAPRRVTPRAMPAVELISMKEEDIAVGGQYMVRIANPRKPFYARAVITNNPKEDPKTGVLLFPFVRGDTQRSFQPRPASEFFRLPAGWKDPTDEDDAEEDEAAPRPATRRPQGNKSTRPRG